MIVTTFVTALIALCGPQGSEAPTAASLISKCFAVYHDAQSLSGTIKLTQSAGNVSLTISTELQLDRPGKLFLHQIKTGSKPEDWLVTSDGSQFSYDRPEGLLGSRDRYVENLLVDDAFHKHIQLGLPDIYGAVLRSISDKSAFLDIAIGRKEDLGFLLSQWPAFKLHGKVKVGEVECYAITGSYRDGQSSPVSGTFELYIKENGEFVRYVVKQDMQFQLKPDNSGRQNVLTDPIHITSIWDSNLELNGKLNPALFKVVTQRKRG